MITLVSAKEASAMPLLVTVIVQLKEAFCATLPVTLLVFVTVRSGLRMLTVLTLEFEEKPLTVAEAVLVTTPAVTSAGVTV